MNRKPPMRSSMLSPKIHNSHRLKIRCSQLPCMNMLVMKGVKSSGKPDWAAQSGRM